MGSFLVRSIADASINSLSPNLNSGGGTQLKIGFETGAKATFSHRGVFRFSLAEFPNQATVDSASLSLRYIDNGLGFPATVNYITTHFNDWVEGNVTWNDYTFSNPWNTPGGDFDTTDRALFNFSTVHPPDGFTIIDVKALVERAIAAGRNQLNVLVKRQFEGFTTASQLYLTRETALKAEQPILIVNFTLAPTFHDREAEVRMLVPVSAGDVLRVRGAQVRGVQELQAKPDGSSLALSLNH